MPPLGLPLMYVGFAALCFATAALGAIRYAHDFTGFYYQPHIIAFTHLITLGWVTSNIFGLLYVVMPMALQTRFPAGKLDHVFFWLYVVGVTGMVAHFWIGRYVGMAYSAGCVYSTILFMAHKTFAAARKGKMQRPSKFFVLLAFVNLLVAGAWGLTVGLNKVHGFLPTATMGNLLAHLHLAAIGWGTMIVFGVAHRLLPMFLPAKPISGRSPILGAVCLQAGALGLFLALLFWQRGVPFAAVVVMAGIALFLRSAVFMVTHRRPAPPPQRPWPDYSLLSAMASLCWLITAAVTGFALLLSKPTETSLQIAQAYGFAGLVGFLSQVVAGMQPRILSVFTWYFAFTKAGSIGGIPRPVDMPRRLLQIATFQFWLLGVIAFIAGIVLQNELPIRFGGACLLSGTVVSTTHNLLILRVINR